MKIKVNELEEPPEDNDLCQGEHIVSLQSGNDFTHQVGRHKLIKEQKCFTAVLTSLICEESH